MGLSDRLSNATKGVRPSDGVSGGGSLIGATVRRRKDAIADSSRRLKVKVHNKLFETIDVAKLETLEPAMVSTKVTAAINDILNEDGRLLTDSDRGKLIEELKNELLGLGPLEPLLRDDEITDILVNGHNQVYVEKRGKLHATDVVFQDDQHLMLIIDRIVSRVGRRVDESSPMVDARLPDGSRINAIIPPLALDGPALSIRRFGKHRFDIGALVEKDALTWDLVEFLLAVVRARLNVIVCGGTGSGKTTMLNCLSAFVPENERIVTIEDSAELSLQQPHVVRLETRPSNLEGRGEVTQRDLVKNCLRMRPDRIVVGEVRGAEVFDMLQAMSTGHDGSIATIHANSPRECLGRLEMMMLLSGVSIPQRAMRQQIASAVNIIVHVSRLSDGSRKVMKISEISGMEGEMIMMQDLFEFVRARHHRRRKNQRQFSIDRHSFHLHPTPRNGRLQNRIESHQNGRAMSPGDLLIPVAVAGFVLVALRAVVHAPRQSPSGQSHRHAPHGAPGRNAGSTDISRTDRPRLSGREFLSWFYRLNLLQKLEENLWQAGIYARIADVLLVILLMFAAGLAVGQAIWGKVLISIGIGAGVAMLPIIYIRVRRQRRIKAFAKQLPYALDLIKSSLEAGHTLLRGLQVVVTEFADPISSEFRSAIEQSRLGLPLARALEEMLKRVPQEDLRLLVVGVARSIRSRQLAAR